MTATTEPADPAAPASTEPAPVLALPAPGQAHTEQRAPVPAMAVTTRANPSYRVLALTEAGVPLTRAFARLVQAVRDAGSEVVPVALPRAVPSTESVPTITELKRGLTSFAKDLVRGLRGGDAASPEPWIVSQLRAVEGRVDAVLATDPEVARIAFPFVDRAFPGAIRIGCDGDYHLEPEWKAVELDAIVVAHPGLGTDLPRVREGHARSFIGGPVTAGAEVVGKRLGAEPVVVGAAPATATASADATQVGGSPAASLPQVGGSPAASLPQAGGSPAASLPQVAVSFARLDPGDVDQLLFQLSLARPERFSLLFLPSQRSGVDELVRARAGTYGLRGKRPKSDGDLEAWIRGSALLVGFPSPAESAAAVAGGVPLLFVTPESRLLEGDRFLVQRGALISEVPITIAVHVEGLLPGGSYRARAEEALRELEPSGPAGAAQAVLAAVKAGRPAPVAAPTAGAARAGDDDLEDIGEITPSAQGMTADLPLAIRRAYLKEIILQQHAIERNLGRAKGGLETWQRRVRLARTAAQDLLADKAIPRVEGLLKVIEQLERELREVMGLRERFASPAPLTAADRNAAARFLSPGTATSIDRGEAPDSAFTQLEIEDALAVLKRKLEGR